MLQMFVWKYIANFANLKWNLQIEQLLIFAKCTLPVLPVNRLPVITGSPKKTSTGEKFTGITGSAEMV